MENMVSVSTELGYITIPEKHLMDMNKLKNYPRKDRNYNHGSQGEAMSALNRMAFAITGWWR